MPQPPPQAPPQPEPKPKRGVLKWIPLGIVLALASCGVIFSAVGGDDGPATTAQPAPAASTTPKSAEASQPPTVKIGDKVRDDDYQFQVTKVTYGVSGVGDSYFGEKP